MSQCGCGAGVSTLRADDTGLLVAGVAGTLAASAGSCDGKGGCGGAGGSTTLRADDTGLLVAGAAGTIDAGCPCQVQTLIASACSSSGGSSAAAKEDPRLTDEHPVNEVGDAKDVHVLLLAGLAVSASAGRQVEMGSLRRSLDRHSEAWTTSEGLLLPDRTAPGTLTADAVKSPAILLPGGIGAVASHLSFAYRTVEFSVSERFFREYNRDFRSARRGPGEGRGLVSSLSEALRALWANYLDDVTLGVGEFGKLLGCYNLGREEIAGNYYFFDDSWGAPFYVIRYACQMVHTYNTYLSYRAGGGACRGFDTFATELLEGNYATNDAGERCSLTINLRNADDRYAQLRDACTAQKPCDGGFNQDTTCDTTPCCESTPWEPMTWTWVSSTGRNCWSGARADHCDPPDTGCAMAAIGNDFNATFEPATLGWDGFVVDWVMYLARLAWDYSRSGVPDLEGALAAADAASKLARYALRIIANWGRILIHEIGHSYLGGGHCVFECCFDRTSRNWLCHVRGRLGLPGDPYTPAYVASLNIYDDFEPTDHFTRQTSACDDDGENYTHWSCDVQANGVVGQHADFCSSGCTTITLTATTGYCLESTGTGGGTGWNVPAPSWPLPCFRWADGRLVETPCDPGDIDPPETPDVDWMDP